MGRIWKSFYFSKHFAVLQIREGVLCLEKWETKEIKAHPSLRGLRTDSLFLNCGESLFCFMTYFVIHTSLCICWSYREVRRLIETRKIVRKWIFWVLGNSNFRELNIWSVVVFYSFVSNSLQILFLKQIQYVLLCCCCHYYLQIQFSSLCGWFDL